jgi:DNA-binding NarL/FixJ family response regulator
MMRPIRVLLADDHALVRAGFRSLLQDLKGIQVIAEAENGREALNQIQEHRPDVVLMDIAMPGMNGLEALWHVTKEFQEVRVVILSMHPNEEYVQEAMRAGAVGYLLKNSSPEELGLCLRAVANGEMYFSPRVSKHAILDYRRRLRGEVPPATSEAGPFQVLTPKQREVLQLLAEGHTTSEIAQILSVSVKTAETHRTRLMKRLDIHDVAGLVRYAVRTGLISPDEST